MSRGFTSFIFIVFLAAYATGDNGLLMQFTRVATSVADVSSSAGQLASALLNRSAEFTSSTSSAVLAVTASTASILDTAWQGVDLCEVKGQVFVGKVLFADASIFENWLRSEAGAQAVGTRELAAITFWVQAVRSISFDIPVQELGTHQVQPESGYWAAHCRTFMLQSGLLAFEFRFASVTFRPRWANPVWQLADVPVDGQINQIVNHVESFIETIPIHNQSWDLLLRGALQGHDSSLSTWVQLRAWDRRAALIGLWLSSFLASYRGVGAMCLIGLLGLHASSIARQSLLSLFSQARKGILVLCWPFARIWLSLKSRIEWVWDSGFELVRPALT